MILVSDQNTSRWDSGSYTSTQGNFVEMLNVLVIVGMMLCAQFVVYLLC